MCMCLNNICCFPSWPSLLSPNLALDHSLAVFLSARASGTFHRLPTEIMQHILQDVPLQSILALSSASRSLRNLITNPPYLKHIIMQAITYGSLRWILPVETMPGEVESALNAFSTWVDKSSPTVLKAIVSPKPKSTLQLISMPSFPHLQFIRACFDLDSMRNRKRLWDIVKQFDGFWWDYQLHGYEVSRFRE